MITSFKFDFENIDDEILATKMLNASNLVNTLWELDQWLRANYKYSAGDITEDAAGVVQTKLRGIMEENSLSFNDSMFS